MLFSRIDLMLFKYYKFLLKNVKKWYIFNIHEEGKDMVSWCRNLSTDISVENFVDNVLQITKKREKKQAINSITAAERNMKDYSKVPTLTHEDNRDFDCRGEREREDLRRQIYNELVGICRLPDDDKIKLIGDCETHL